jgi:hypothetical protein
MAHFLSIAIVVAGLLGLLIPHIQAILERPEWPARVKAIVTVVLAVIFGLLTYVAANGVGWINGWDPYAIIAWISGVWAASALIYARLTRPVGTTDALEYSINNPRRVSRPDRNSYNAPPAA